MPSEGRENNEANTYNSYAFPFRDHTERGRCGLTDTKPNWAWSNMGALVPSHVATLVARVRTTSHLSRWRVSNSHLGLRWHFRRTKAEFFSRTRTRTITRTIKRMAERGG